MDWIREYLLRLICAALLCGIVNGLLSKKGALGAAVKLITGIFMVITMVSPLLRIRIDNITGYFDGISSDANAAVESGQMDAADALKAIIKSKTEAYILDKAKSYGAEVTVEVRVDGSDLPAPCSVSVSGSISPYGKKQLSSMIADELGIALEDQEWTG